MNNIIAIIDKKTAEHKSEVFSTLDEMQKVQRKVQDNIVKGVKDLQESQKLFIIKGKLDFHKACIAALQDLKETLNGEKDKGSSE